MTTSLEAAEAFYTALDAGDVPTIVALCAEDATVVYPADGRLPYGGAWTGRDRIAAFLEAHDEAEEILALDIHRMLADGTMVVVIGEYTGRARPNGGAWSTPFAHVLAFADGLLQRWEAFFDTAAALDARR